MATLAIILFCTVGLTSAMPLTSQVTNASITEYLALAPEKGDLTLKWVKITYPEGVSSAKDVKIAALPKSTPEVGAWFDMDSQSGFKNSAKILGDQMYAYMDVNGTADDGEQMSSSSF